MNNNEGNNQMTMKIAPVINLESSKRSKKNQGSQTGQTLKDKAVQTMWILNEIEVAEDRKSNREEVLHFIAKEHCFSKMRRELEIPEMLSPIEENSMCKVGGDKDDWKNWKVGEFVWEEDKENIKETKKKQELDEKKRKSDANEGGEIRNGKERKTETWKGQENDLKTLEGANWLNDVVINSYLELIGKEGNQEQQKKLRGCAMNSFFFPRLHISGHTAVKRWTKKTNIFKFEKMMIPIHLGNHWSLAVINFLTKNITYYDSLRRKDQGYLRTLLHYLDEEARIKGEDPINQNEWTLGAEREIPTQQNGFDCGVFVCLYAKYEALNKKFDFSQRDMPQMRLLIKRELMEEILLK
ncbi:sentrin-specific protease 1-like [Venturia canescens]|uniref:sentrin-specific protease 1-like n=1 Tax=Venturia canescens TaxID=32260 RepID=UPI001C9C5F8C|nr:sentrin-specific protease 1-like [Venturia canescens]